jgi:methyl-accepting chemotaxis protein
LTLDNPSQNARAQNVRALIDERAANLHLSVEQIRKGDPDQDATTARGRLLMLLVEARLGDFLTEERMLSNTRMATAGSHLDGIRWLVLGGVPIALLLVVLMGLVLIRRIRRPVEAMVAVMSQLGAGERSARIEGAMGSQEFERLAQGYNAMADELAMAVSDQNNIEERLRSPTLN